MAAGPLQRKLAATLAADVFGYSRLMGEDTDFGRSWDSLQAFRADDRIWKDLGFLD